MSSIIPGYEHDIFISYHQKYNKGEKWIGEFVDALKTKLKSTFKVEISEYFDIDIKITYTQPVESISGSFFLKIAI